MQLWAKNEEINQWLSDHPGVLGSCAIVLSLVLLSIGIGAIVTGRASSKYGTEIKGNQARLYGFVIAGFGALCLLFGLYKVAVAVF